MECSSFWHGALQEKERRGQQYDYRICQGTEASFFVELHERQQPDLKPLKATTYKPRFDHASPLSKALWPTRGKRQHQFKGRKWHSERWRCSPCPLRTNIVNTCLKPHCIFFHAVNRMRNKNLFYFGWLFCMMTDTLKLIYRVCRLFSPLTWTNLCWRWDIDTDGIFAMSTTSFFNSCSATKN